jgi:hypothetical protein
VCGHCPGPAACRDKPTAAEPLVQPCQGCTGSGCHRCGGAGEIAIAGCPLEIVPAEAYEIVELAATAAEHGLMPVAGGLLDQAAVFLTAARMVWAEKARIEAGRNRRQ